MEDNPTGTLSKSKMMEMYSSVLSIHKATKFVEEIFLKYDTDNNGFIDFKVTFNSFRILLQYCVKEFMLATKPDEPATEEKLRWAFRMYDTDSSGTLYEACYKISFILFFRHN